MPDMRIPVTGPLTVTIIPPGVPAQNNLTEALAVTSDAVAPAEIPINIIPLLELGALLEPLPIVIVELIL